MREHADYVIFRKSSKLDEMKSLILVLLTASCCFAFQTSEASRWEKEAKNVTIMRDDWGIAHVHGKTDADAVFGMIYAQAEDDFNRVETNYLTSLGRLAEAEGESKIYQDLRMKLFIDPAELKKEYAASPAWLQSLMNAWADGLNFYLAKHPDVKPRVIRTFRALDGAQLHRRQHRRRYRASQSQSACRRSTAKPPSGPAAEEDQNCEAEPSGSNGMAIAPSNTRDHHALLLINPHTSFFFRSELQMMSDEGLNAYGAVTWGQFFIYQGFNDRAGWMHTSSGVDAVDEYLETVTKKGDALLLQIRQRGAPVHRQPRSPCPTRPIAAWRRKIFTVYRTHHGPIVREANGKWVSYPPHAGAHQGARAILHAHQGERLQILPRNHGAEGQLVEQHHLRRRRRRHRLLPRQFHSPARYQLRLDQARGRHQSRNGVERAACSRRNAAPAESARAAGSTTPTTGPGPPPARAVRRSEDYPAYVENGRRIRARPARHPRARKQEGFHRSIR